MAVSWEEKFNDLQKEYDEYKVIADIKISELTKTSSNPSTKLSHNFAFWQEVKNKCIAEPDSVKLMIKNKELSLTDLNIFGETVLNIAAKCGAYQLVQFCINSGADLNHKDNNGRTPAENAKQCGYFSFRRAETHY